MIKNTKVKQITKRPASQIPVTLKADDQSDFEQELVITSPNDNNNPI